MTPQDARHTPERAPSLPGRALFVPWRSKRALVGCAVCAAVVVVCLLTLLCRGEDEKVRLQAAVAEMATRASPEIAELLHETSNVATRLLEQFPHNADALATIASLYDRLGKAGDAVRCWQKCMDMDPSLTPMCHAAIAEVALDQGQQDRAADHFRMAMERDPGSSTYPVQLAEVWINQGKLTEAVEILERDLKAHPRSMPAFALLGQARLQLKQYDQAKRCLEMAIELGPNYTNAYYGLVTACAKLGDQEKSREYLQKFKALKAQDEQRHRDALKTKQDTAEFRTAVAQVCTGAAKIYIVHGDVRTGEEYLLRASALAPDGVECRSLLAWLYERQGRIEKALQTLAELSERAPGDLGAQLSIAAAYGRLQRFDQAEMAYRNVVDLRPNQAGGYAALANFYLQAERKLAEAKTLALKAVKIEPVAKHYYLLCLACLNTGDRAEALAAIEQALALDADNTEYRHLHQMMKEEGVE